MQRMAPEVIIAILAGVICVVMGGLSLWRRRLGVQSEPACIEPWSLVRVIESREELEDAVRRAAAFERGMAVVLERRADRLEAR